MDIQNMLEIILDKFQARFLVSQKEIENLLKIENPNQKDVDFLKNKVPNNLVTRGYFFENLENPNWLILLYDNKFFSHPPQIDKSDDRTIFPFWPQSRCLARIADKDPYTVLDIMFKIPEVNNFRIHEDFVDAACKMPVDLATKWAIKEAEWICRQEDLHWWLPEKEGNFISHLVKGNEIEAALMLAKSLLGILPDPNYKDEINSEDSSPFASFMSPEPKIRFEIRDYQDIINKNIIPDLVPVSGMRSLELLCDLLMDSLRLKGKEGPADLSYIWRKAIEDHEQNFLMRPEEILVSAVRDTGKELLKESKKHVFEYLEHDDRCYLIFKRISLYLRRIYKTIDLKKTKSILLDPKVMDDPHYWHEFYQLINEIYPEFLPKEKGEYLKIIKEAAPEKKFIRTIEDEKNEKLPESEKERMIIEWQYQKLFPIQEYLESVWNEEFNQMQKKFGKLEHPDFESYTGTAWVGPTSPKTLDELKDMSVDELVRYCKDEFKPSADPMTPSPEGLSRNLNVLVQDHPALYSDEAMKFKILIPPYIRGIIGGFRDAVKAHNSFDWGPVLALCHWVVVQKDEILDYNPEYKDEKGWSWTRRRIADLLETGLKSSSVEIPIHFKDKVWPIIEKLTHDPEPDEEHERQYGGDNMGPATLSINTVRGNAMHALVQYALWIMRDIEGSEDKKDNIKMDFHVIPEVQMVLENHLDINNDSSTTIRSVYGRWFPWLVSLDEEWAKTNMRSIFPFDKSEELMYFGASWGTYITFNRPYDQVFTVMREVYDFVVDHPEFLPQSDQGMSEPDQDLAEHLVVLFWRGIIEMEEPDSLIVRYFQNVSPELRGHAIMFIGRCLEDMQDTEIKRLQQLLEYRLEEVESVTDKLDIQEEFKWFGILLESGKLDNQWILENMKKLLVFGINFKNRYKIMNRFESLVEIFTETILDCIGLMIQNEPEGYFRIYEWKDSVYKILQKALRIDGSKSKAEDLVHRMGSIGFLEFKDLLNSL